LLILPIAIAVWTRPGAAVQRVWILGVAGWPFFLRQKDRAAEDRFAGMAGRADAVDGKPFAIAAGLAAVLGQVRHTFRRAARQARQLAECGADVADAVAALAGEERGLTVDHARIPFLNFLEIAMEIMRRGTIYRDYTVVVNPADTPKGRFTDAFSVQKHDETDPNLRSTAFQRPISDAFEFQTEEEAKDSAMKIAKGWIDKQY
jgi:hypothetical protein